MFLKFKIKGDAVAGSHCKVKLLVLLVLLLQVLLSFLQFESNICDLIIFDCRVNCSRFVISLFTCCKQHRWGPVDRQETRLSNASSASHRAS